METKEPLKDEALTGSVEIGPSRYREMCASRQEEDAADKDSRGGGGQNPERKKHVMSKQGKWKGVEIKN